MLTHFNLTNHGLQKLCDCRDPCLDPGQHKNDDINYLKGSQRFLVLVLLVHVPKVWSMSQIHLKSWIYSELFFVLLVCCFIYLCLCFLVKLKFGVAYLSNFVSRKLLWFSPILQIQRIREKSQFSFFPFFFLKYSASNLSSPSVPTCSHFHTRTHIHIPC